MKVSCLPSVRVLVTVLAGVAAGCSEGDAADQMPRRAEGPPEHSANIQRIRTLDCEGAFVCKQGQLLFITGQGKGHCLDLAGDPSSPVVLSDSLPPAWDVAVKGNYALVVANSRMLTVYDMGDGKTWRRIADCSTPAAAENVIVRDDLAYVAGCRAGLQIISIRDPNSPVLVGESTVAKQDIDAIGLVGNVAYLYDHLHGTLRLVDVTDPANSAHLSLFEFGRPFIQGEMDVCRGYAYCVAGDDGVVIVDVRDRMAPKLAAVFDTPGYATDVIVSDGFAFVADGEGGIRVADVRDPGKPVEVGCFTSKDLNARQLALLGNLVYVANEPPLRAVILRFEPPLKCDSQGR
jgi:hypothetical protein